MLARATCAYAARRAAIQAVRKASTSVRRENKRVGERVHGRGPWVTWEDVDTTWNEGLTNDDVVTSHRPSWDTKSPITNTMPS